jgi:hypothetical protein
VPDTVMACRVLARADFECLRAASADYDLAACAPHW